MRIQFSPISRACPNLSVPGSKVNLYQFCSCYIVESSHNQIETFSTTPCLLKRCPHHYKLRLSSHLTLTLTLPPTNAPTVLLFYCVHLLCSKSGPSDCPYDYMPPHIQCTDNPKDDHVLRQSSLTTKCLPTFRTTVLLFSCAHLSCSKD